ncbi:MAG TPA: lipid-binding SYLF domain-containing protein [Acidobacteriaceae bacterium]|jgi:lipid-binding SYLF domain-containing protein|nr:lipid-binding SYLF domain-containing protein [Acidobacteriaceae bacterium]
MIQHRNRMLTIVGAAVAALFLLTPLVARAADEDADTARITASGDVLKELLDSPSGISHDLLNKAYCVIILPSVKKGGFIVAAQYGRGIMTCRSGNNFDGSWSAPIMMQSSGGSVGFQIGGQATDFVILVMNDQGARAVMNGKAKLGSDASVAAGPVGRTAEASTNASMSAEMLSYSRSQGVFAGISLSGTSLGPDSTSNTKIYGKAVTGTEISSGSVQAPATASTLLSTLASTSPTRSK